MEKRTMSLRMRIPPYRHPRNAWRELIHSEVVKVAQARCLYYLLAEQERRKRA